MKVNVKIDNLDRILGAVQAEPALIVPKINTAIKQAIVKVNQVARGDKLSKYVYDTPERGYRRTGNLRSKWNITYGTLQASTGPLMNYAIYLHEGTRFIHPARPFLQEAVDDLHDTIQEYFAVAIGDTLQEVAQRSK